MTSVLIVEDQRMPRENMEHLVEDSGRYRRVASLSTAEMALAQCARHAVDLVLMDVCTKGSRDGIDVAAEIKARHPETKVIIITSYNKIVVFIDRSPAECYNKFRMLWIGGTSPTAKTVFGRLQPQLLCRNVNQLDTARRFI